MKNAISQIFMLVIVMGLTLSCTKKQPNEEQVVIDATNLTACPQKGTCTYLYLNNSDFAEDQFILKSGSYKVFTGDIQSPPTSRLFFIKVPMNKTSFSLSKQDILNGAVKFTDTCPTCYSISKNITDGYVKGISVYRASRPYEHRWLLEAQIVFSYEGSGTTVTDTLKLKQFFNPGFSAY